MNFNEIKAALIAEFYNKVKDYAYSSGGTTCGLVDKVEKVGGEGEGETWFVVFYYKEHDCYIKVRGHYQSYDGTSFYGEFECLSEVKPVEKTITVYE